MPASNDFTKQLAPVSRPNSEQIAGIVRMVARGRNVRYATFEHYLGVVSFPKPTGIVL
jgi:hypothetical protein